MKTKKYYGSMAFEVDIRDRVTSSVGCILRDYKKLLEDMDKSVKKWVPKEVSNEKNIAKRWKI